MQSNFVLKICTCHQTHQSYQGQLERPASSLDVSYINLIHTQAAEAMSTSKQLPTSGLKTKSALFKGENSTDPVRGAVNVLDLQCLPGIFKGKNVWDDALQRRRREIMEWRKPSATDKFLSSIIGKRGPAGNNQRVTGESLQKHHLIKSNTDLVRQLSMNPQAWQRRNKLCESLVRSGRTFAIEVHRENFLQMLTPMAAGVMDPHSWKVMISVYDGYLKQLRDLILKKQKLLEHHIKVSEAGSQNHANMEKLGQNYNVLHELISLSNKPDVRNLKIKPFYLTDLFNGPEKAKMQRRASSDSVTPLVVDPRQLIMDVGKVVNSMRFLPILHPLAIIYVNKLLKRYPQYLMGYILLGRVHRQMLGFAVVRHSAGEEGMMPVIKTQLQKCLEAYGKGKRFVPATVNPISRVLYKEYSSVILYSYTIRKVLGVPPEVLRKLLSIAKENMSQIPSLEKGDLDLQIKISTALDDMG